METRGPYDSAFARQAPVDVHVGEQSARTAVG